MNTLSETALYASNIPGLSESEGPGDQGRDTNELPSAKRSSFLSIVYEVVREPMFLLHDIGARNGLPEYTLDTIAFSILSGQTDLLS